MDSCEAVERELDKVTSKFGNVCKDSIAKLEDVINALRGVLERNGSLSLHILS